MIRIQKTCFQKFTEVLECILLEFFVYVTNPIRFQVYYLLFDRISPFDHHQIIYTYLLLLLCFFKQ